MCAMILKEIAFLHLVALHAQHFQAMLEFFEHAVDVMINVELGTAQRSKQVL